MLAHKHDNMRSRTDAGLKSLPGRKKPSIGEERLARAAETDFGKCDHVVMAPRVGTAPLARARMTPRRRVPYRNRW